MSIDACLSSEKMDWQTPGQVLTLVRQVGHGNIALDPCTTPENPTNASVFYAPPMNGLEEQWSWVDGLVYCNPPYGRALPAWIRKCCVEGSLETEIVLLVPSRTDTNWYDDACDSALARCEWRGRIKFVGAPSCAPFPSALFYWGPNPHLFCHVFQSHGRVQVMR